MAHHYRHKNLLFYSWHDQGSRTFMKELSQRPLLDQQFIKICINDSRVRIPQRILQYNRIPVVVCPGFDKPILGPDALSWLQNNAFETRSNGTHEFGNLDQIGKLSSEYSQLLEEFKPTQYNQYHNSEWNLGFDQSNDKQTTRYAGVENATTHRIETFEEDTKKNAASVLERRFDLLKQQRDKDSPRGERIASTSDKNTGRDNGVSATDMPVTTIQQAMEGPAGGGFHGMGSDLNQAYQPIIGGGPVGKDAGGRVTASAYNPNIPPPPPAGQRPGPMAGPGPRLPPLPPQLQPIATQSPKETVVGPLRGPTQSSPSHQSHTMPVMPTIAMGGGGVGGVGGGLPPHLMRQVPAHTRNMPGEGGFNLPQLPPNMPIMPYRTGPGMGTGWSAAPPMRESMANDIPPTGRGVPNPRLANNLSLMGQQPHQGFPEPMGVGGHAPF